MRSTTLSSALLVCTASLLLGGSLAAEAISPRWQNHSKRAFKGTDKFITTAATYFGTQSHEEFLSVATLPNGDIVAVGNAWGPDFPEQPKAEILGKGEWYDVPEYAGGKPYVKNKKGKEVPAPLAREYPNKAGFIVVYSSDLQTIKRIVKFDWGVASISRVCVLPDGDIVIGGRSLAAFDETVANKAKHRHTYPRPSPDDYGDQFDEIADQSKKDKAIANYRNSIRKNFGEVYYEGVKMPGNAYLMRLRNLTEPVWVVTLEGYRDMASELTVMKEEYIAFSSQGVKRVKLADGEPDKSYGGGTRRNAKAFNPYTGEWYRGGYRNTGTGREPYKNPYLYCYGEDGQQKWEAYRWNSAMVGHDWFRLVSDSSVKQIMPDHEGYLWVSLWSDGGNTVATKNPFNILQPARNQNSLGMSSWGAQIASFTHFVRFNPETLDFAAYVFWGSYLPRTGTPNSVTTSRLGVLKDNSMVVIGGSASCLVQTKHAFVEFPEIIWDQQAMNKDGAPGIGYGGKYVAIFNKELTSIRFSSYLPGMNPRDFADGPDNGFLLVSSVDRPDDGRDPPWGVVPVEKAVQPEFAGGRMDGHILLMHDPKEQ